MKKQTAYLCISLLLFTVTAIGQNQENKNPTNTISKTLEAFNRVIKLENDSKPKEITVNVKEKTKEFQLLISSTVTRGKIKIDLYNPKGILKGTFKVETQLDTEIEEIVRGNIKKSLKEPQSGNWKIKITPVGATGTIMINSNYIL